MKRAIAILAGVVVFGWMAVAGTCFLVENPGLFQSSDGPLRVVRHIHESLAMRSFRAWPLEIPVALAASVLLFCALLGSGLWILRALGFARRGTLPPTPNDLSSLEEAALAGALGLGAWGMLIFLFGVARQYGPGILVLSLVAIAALLTTVRWTRTVHVSAWIRPRGPAEWTATILAAIALLLGLIYTLTPAIQSDGLRYHLAAPQDYLRNHRILYIPFNAFTNFPFLIEMLFTLALCVPVGGDLLAKMMHFECFVLTGLFVALLTSRLLEGLKTEGEAQTARGPSSARRGLLPLLATLVFWTTPTALLTGSWEFIDLGTALFFVAMIYALVRWHCCCKTDWQSVSFKSQTGYQPVLLKERRRWLWVVALFLGFLIGTKYTMLAMLGVVPLALLFELVSFAFGFQSAIESTGGPPAFHPKSAIESTGGPPAFPLQSQIQNLKSKIIWWLQSSVFVGLIGVAVALPWFIKNTIYTRNPVYPLAWGVFDGGEWSAENARFYLEKSSLKGYNPRHDRNIADTLRHLIATPWEATIYWRTRPELGHPGYEDQFLGPLFLLWIPLLLRVLMDVKHRAPREGPFRLVVLFAVVYGAIWYSTYQSSRLLIPALAALAVLIAYSLAVAERAARWLSQGALVVLLVACLYNVEWSANFVFGETTGKPSPAPYWLGFQSRDSYIRQAFPSYAMFQQMPNYVQPGEKVLFVGEYRTFHCPVECRASDWFDTPLILHYIQTTRDNDALLDRLLEENIRWVYYDDAELALYEEAFFLPRFSRPEGKRFSGLFRVSGYEKFWGLSRGELGGGARRIIAAHPRLRPVVEQPGMYLYEVTKRSP